MTFLRARDGGAAVEFAFVAPFLAIILGGIIEVGNLIQTSILAGNAAREGARYAALGDCYDAQNAPVAYMNSALAGRGNVSVGTVTLNPSSCPPSIGSAVTVSVPVTVTLDMPVVQKILGGSFTLTGKATMQRYTNA
jgi:Flp pilus assembly protein TadG